jgi:DNA-binding HxlR family transcriptional regulator
MNGVRRFDDLVERLAISRATLTDRLRRLTAAGILAPAEYLDARGRRREEYRLTPKGWELQFVFVALREWGDRNVIGPGREPLRLVDQGSGRDVRLALVDPATGDVVDPRRVVNVPGPGFLTRDGERTASEVR